MSSGTLDWSRSSSGRLSLGGHDRLIVSKSRDVTLCQAGVLYRLDVWSPITMFRLSVLAAYLSLANSFQLFLVALLAAVISPAAVVYALLGLASLGLAALLLIRAPNVPLLLVSALAGSLATLAGLAARESALPIALVLAFTATSIAITVASATAARIARPLR
jgi:hypothetical protein